MIDIEKVRRELQDLDVDIKDALGHATNYDKSIIDEAIEELERLQKRDENVKIKLIKRIELNKKIIKENYDVDTEVVSHLIVENTALEMVMMLMDWSEEE